MLCKIPECQIAFITRVRLDRPSVLVFIWRDSLHSFSITALNKLPHLVAEKKYKLIILQFYDSEVRSRSQQAKIKVSAELHFFLKAVRENLFHHAFQFLQAASISWLMTSSSTFRNSRLSSNHIINHLSGFLLSPSSYTKEPCDYLRPTWTIQNTLHEDLLISNLNSLCNFNLPLPCNLTQSQILKIRT